MKKDLEKLSKNLYIHPDDPNYAYKKNLYGGGEENPIKLADSYVKMNQKRKAKEIYLQLLRIKETWGIHKKVVNLLTLEELLHTAKTHSNTRVKKLYYDRVLQISPKNKEARLFFHNPWKKRIFILILILLLLLTALIIWKNIIHNKKQENYYTQMNFYNTIQYTNKAPGPLQEILIIPQAKNKDLQELTHYVDTLNIPYNKIVGLQMKKNKKVIGYAKREAGNTYQFWIPISSENMYQLNTVRTAYQFYVQQHQEQPPSSLNVLKNMVPQLKNINYTPEQNPVAAISQKKSEVALPFIKPEIIVNLAQKTLKLEYGNHVLLQTPIGQGSNAHPTPVGEYTITGRIKENPTSIYGPYAFPLNYSHYAIHGTNNSGRINKKKSIGCIEVPNTIDKKLYQLIPVGTEVVIEKGNANTSLKNQMSFY